MKARFLLLLLLFTVFIHAQTTSWDGVSWSNGAPNAGTDVLITGNYDTSINGGFAAKNLSISATGSMLIASNTTITVQSDLDNLGNFTIEDSGSLIMVDDVGTVFGNYVVKRDTPNYPELYMASFFSSPVIEADSNITSTFSSTDFIYYWDTSVSPSNWELIEHEDGMGNSNKLGLGKGYSIASTILNGVVTRVFTGEVNTGDIAVPVYYSDSSTSPGQFGYNIIGNPYPSAIDWFAFKSDNASILSGTMYLWRQQASGTVNHASSYIALNALGTVPYNSANQFIGSAQGFVVKTNATSNVVFKNSHRASNNEQFFRNSEGNRINTANNSWLQIEGDGRRSTVLIGFNSNATTGFDDDYDGVFIGGTDALQLYSLMGADKLLINGQPELTVPNNVSIPLGVKVSSTGNYTMSIEEEFINPNYFIKLEDTQTSTITDLRLGDYTFNVSSTVEDNSRFILHYEYDTTLGVSDIINEDDFKAYFNGNDLNLKINRGQTLPETVSIHNLNGKLVFASSYAEIISTNNLSSGAYIISLEFNNIGLISKSIVKK